MSNMDFKLGVVQSNAAIANDGTIKVCFDLQNHHTGQAKAEDVRYVTPYGSNHAGFIGIPLPGALVLCGYASGNLASGKVLKGYFYIGSVMGNIPGLNGSIPSDESTGPTQGAAPEITTQSFVPKTQTGVHGPPIDPDEIAYSTDTNPWPDKFREMYGAKGIVPEQVGFTNIRGDDVLISNRSRPNRAEDPFQDHRVQIESGSGKAVKCVDSPIVDGIIMSNEHKGKDYFIFSSGNSGESPFSAGEWHMRTHGPVNQYTTYNNMHLWVEEGLNLQLENLATGQCGRDDEDGNSPTKQINTNTGAATSRIDDHGNETWGCVELRSANNNVIIEALAPDSTIRIIAPGDRSKTIINTGGSVDIVAMGKITLQSDTEVEINAPQVDINGSDNVYIDGGRIDLNLPHPDPQL